MRNSPFLFVLIGLMVVLDFYVFQAMKMVTQTASPKIKAIIYITYWVFSILALLLFILLPYINFDNYPKGVRSMVFALLVALFFSKLITSVFLLMDDIRRGFQWVAGKMFFSNTEGEDFQSGEAITRSHFLSWLGLAAGAGLFGSLVYGFSNKYNYKVKSLSLNFPNLPSSFKGLKVVQISDIHTGSFNNKVAVQKGVEKILSLKPDLIFFTGDLVNNKADEMREYKEVFSQLKAPLGVFSVLGNHDYGDYVQWETKQQKEENLNALMQVHENMGWRLLMNEHLLLQRGKEKIAIIGVENWSAKARFPKYGDLDKAYTGSEQAPFKILLSHDPSHWEGEVVTRFKDIDLMLSGHTHGMQFGVEVPWLKWSPVQYVYKQWAGLYENGVQKLYVNRGFGFIGYPGRVGVLPEITFMQFT